MDFTALKKIFFNLVLQVRSGGQRSRTHYLINAHRDWSVALSVFSVTVVLVAGFSVYLFLGISRGEIFLVETPQSARISNIDRTLLSEIIFVYEEKKRIFEIQKTNPPVLADPSR